MGGNQTSITYPSAGGNGCLKQGSYGDAVPLYPHLCRDGGTLVLSRVSNGETVKGGFFL